MSSYRHILFIIAICLLCCSCVPRGIRKAQCVVAQADSLWHEGKMYGVDEGDSATLAKAYETLGNYNLSPFIFNLSYSYAHSCYHYGRLLRAKDNPVEAMQVFIEATHSHTRDYHILGRVYNNMGDICHLAGDFPLSYTMFERSADMFLRENDSLSYYYCLNDMAYELAEQGKKEETLHLLEEIPLHCVDSDVMSNTQITISEVYLHHHQYDSVLFYARKVLELRKPPLISYMQIAQAYSHLGIKDSAVLYAQKVVSETQNIGELNNALYILTNDDASKDIAAVREVAAERSDMQKLLEIRKGKMSQAAQLLEQDIHRKPNLTWLYAIIVTLIIVGFVIIIYVHRKHKKQKLLSQQIEDLNIQNVEAQEQLATLTKEIGTLSQLHDAHHKEIVIGIEKFCAMIQSKQDLQEYLHWRNFTEMCQLTNKYLYNLVTRLEPYNLSPKEIRLCVLVLLKAGTNQMVDMIPYAPSGLGKFKYTTAQKLGTTTPNLRTFLLCLLG